MEETVVYKLDVSDEQINQMAMKTIWEESGITFVEVKKKGKLKMTGKFDKFDMVMKLKKIDESADIIITPERHNPITSLLPDFLNFSEKQEIVVFEFKKLDDNIKRIAMAIIWEFSGVSSVKVKRKEGQLEVKGIFEKYETAMKLQAEIDESVKIIDIRPDLEVEKEVKHGPNKNVFVGLGPRGSDGKKKYDFNFAGTSKRPTQGAFGDFNKGIADDYFVVKQQQIEKEKADAHWQRIEKEKIAADRRQRMEKQKAAAEKKKRNDEKQQAAVEKQQRIEKDKAAAERQRGGNSTWIPESFSGLSSWFPGSSSTANTSSSRAHLYSSRSTLSSSAMNASQATLSSSSGRNDSESTLSSSTMINPYSSLSTGGSECTQSSTRTTQNQSGSFAERYKSGKSKH